MRNSEVKSIWKNAHFVRTTVQLCFCQLALREMSRVSSGRKATKRSRACAVIIIAEFVLSTIGHGQTVTTQSEGRNVSHEAYLFGLGGEFVKVDAANVSLQAYWSLPRVAGLSDVFPPYCPTMHTAAGPCMWSGHNLTYDKIKKRLYGVFPKKNASSGTGEADEFQLVALHLPLMELAGAIDIPGHPTAPPAFVIKPDGKTLLLEYTEKVVDPKIQKERLFNVIGDAPLCAKSGRHSPSTKARSRAMVALNG